MRIQRYKNVSIASSAVHNLLFFFLCLAMPANFASALKNDGLFKEGLNANTVTIIGGGENARDILCLRGVDMGLVRADVIDTLRDQPHYGDLDQRLKYISVLYLEAFHVWTSKPEIETINNLQDKTVAAFGSGEKSVGILLGKLCIKPGEIIAANVLGVAASIGNGAFDALVRFVGKPVADLDEMSS